MNLTNLNKINSFLKINLLEKPTTLHALANINKLLNGVEIYVKREDVTGLGLGGNKLRKLEFLVADAKRKGADVLITSGGVQSNHARLTAATAAKLGLDCELVLRQSVPIAEDEYHNNGNLLLDRIMDVKTHVIGSSEDVQKFTNNRVAELTSAKRKPYVIPMGGSSAIGCLGYASCFAEIINQSEQQKVHFNYIVVPNGSGGTHAGLLAGLKALENEKMKVKSYTVLAPQQEAVDITCQKTKETLRLIDEKIVVSRNEVLVEGNARGEGYGIPTEEMKEAVRLLAQKEGLFLDPVYSGKAFAGLLKDIREGKFEKGAKILFLMTGGAPGLFAYSNIF